MAFPISVTIYGTNIQPTSSTATKSTLDADTTNYKSWNFNAYTINAKIEHEDENRRYWNNRSVSKNIIRPKYEVKMQPLSYPSATNLQTFYHSEIFSKKYHYIYFNNYTLPDNDISSGKVLAVAITELSIEPNYEEGAKDIVITLENMFSE